MPDLFNLWLAMQLPIYFGKAAAVAPLAIYEKTPEGMEFYSTPDGRANKRFNTKMEYCLLLPTPFDIAAACFVRRVHREEL